jgi:nucleotide-binding universal stress UspA family protein
MKKIIVPIDFSDESINGLELAIMISSKTRANIQLVYVMKKSADFSQVSQEEELRFAKSGLNDLQVKYEHKLAKGVVLSNIVKRGKIYDEIVEQAESFEDSVIVVSTHGASGFEEFFIGSNAFRIITASERPVIAIRHGVVPKSFRRILMPIDYTQDTRQKVPYTAELAKVFDSQVHLVAVTGGKDQELIQKIKSWTNQAAEYLAESGIETITSSRTGENIADMVIDYAKTEKIDLVSIMTDQGTSISNFIIGNNAQQLLSKSPVPVLCITPKELHLRGSFRTYGG